MMANPGNEDSFDIVLDNIKYHCEKDDSVFIITPGPFIITKHKNVNGEYWGVPSFDEFRTPNPLIAEFGKLIDEHYQNRLKN